MPLAHELVTEDALIAEGRNGARSWRTWWACGRVDGGPTDIELASEQWEALCTWDSSLPYPARVVVDALFDRTTCLSCVRCRRFVFTTTPDYTAALLQWNTPHACLADAPRP